jgi:hypothetical protein
MQAGRRSLMRPSIEAWARMVVGRMRRVRVRVAVRGGMECIFSVRHLEKVK